SKSVAQSVTGGRFTVAPGSVVESDGAFGAVRRGELRAVFAAGAEVAGGGGGGVSEVVDVEQIRGHGVAAVVGLAAIGVDGDRHACAAVGSVARASKSVVRRCP